MLVGAAVPPPANTAYINDRPHLITRRPKKGEDKVLIDCIKVDIGQGMKIAGNDAASRGSTATTRVDHAAEPYTAADIVASCTARALEATQGTPAPELHTEVAKLRMSAQSI